MEQAGNRNYAEKYYNGSRSQEYLKQVKEQTDTFEVAGKIQRREEG